MAKAHQTWTVLPHGPLAKLGDNLFRVEARLPSGPPLQRVMAVAKRSDGRLVVHGAIALDEPSMKELESAGDVGFVVVPNGYHRLDAKIWKDRYPKAKVVAPSGSRKKVEEVVPVDMTYDEYPQDDSVRLERLDGIGEIEGVMIVRAPSGTTLVFNDAVFNMPHHGGVNGLVLKALGSSGGPRVSRLFRLTALKNKATFAGNLERLADTPNLTRVMVAHHEDITTDPADTLRKVARSL